MNLILLEPEEVLSHGAVTLTGTRASHLRQVLGVSVGHPVKVGIVNGPVGVGRVVSIHDDAIALQCTLDQQAPPVPALDLILAVPRPKVLKRLWAQLAALGVARIMLTNAERVEPSYFDSHVLDERVYRPLLVEGLQQVRDTRLPVVSVHRRFRVLVEDELNVRLGAAARFVAQPGAGPSPAEAVRASVRQRVALAIGPEGGWNVFELDLLTRHGFQSVALGSRTLRTDTAVIALIAVIHEALLSRALPS